MDTNTNTNAIQPIFDLTFPRTADALMRQLSAERYRDCTAEIYLFEDQDKRQAMYTELLSRGIHAKVRSAYKPLVHFFLEELDTSGVSRIQIEYPRHAMCVENRFLLEAYPLTELFSDIDIEFQPGAEAALTSHYQVVLFYPDRTQEYRVFVPNVLQNDFLGSSVYTPSAWLTITAASHDASLPSVDGPVVAEYQQAYQALMQAVAEYDWDKKEPYFDQLTITMHLPGIARDLSYAQEHISTIEAMHEEVYFSLLEFFQHYGGRPQGDRGLQPGQIVPDIRLDNHGTPRVCLTMTACSLSWDEEQEADPMPFDLAKADQAVMDLSTVDGPLAARLAESALLGIPGRGFAFRSRQGRAVNGVHHEGSLPAVVISGAQHANETSGVVGTLRAAQQLTSHPNAHFVLIPLENPDGYALHQALCAVNPRHMHHAARYTALGDDLEYRERAPWFERRARDHAFQISQAQLHLNLHGYPAHEWTRPCTGYLPRGFELWSIPKGFFLILRHKPDSKDIATRLLEHVTLALSGNTRLAAYNAQQLRAYERYVTNGPFQVKYGIPYIMTPAPDQRPAVTLITEFPDETIYGDEFVFAHTVQMETVVCATQWWWTHS